MLSLTRGEYAALRRAAAGRPVSVVARELVLSGIGIARPSRRR